MRHIRTAPRRVPGSGATRLAAVAAAGLATAAATLLAGAPAEAAPTGTVDCSGSGEHPCYRDGGSFTLHNDPVVTGLVTVTVKGRTLSAYRTGRADVDTPARYRQHHWNRTKSWPSKAAHRRRASINWILHNSYPAVPYGRLASHLGEDPRTLHLRGRADAVAATQAAIWHFTGALSDTDMPQFTAAEKVLYRDLTMKAGTLASKPAPTLSTDPTSLSGTAGAQAGPLTVHTDAGAATLTTTGGVWLVDGSGSDVDKLTVHDGDRVSLRLPDGAAGSGAVHASATGTVHRGRILAATAGGQWLLATGAKKATTRVTVPVDWTAAGPSTGPSASTTPSGTPSASPSPSGTSSAPASTSPSASSSPGGGLPVTGTALSLIAGIGAALLAAGALLLLLLRRRRNSA